MPASEHAGKVDHLFFFILAITGAVGFWSPLLLVDLRGCAIDAGRPPTGPRGSPACRYWSGAGRSCQPASLRDHVRLGPEHLQREPPPARPTPTKYSSWASSGCGRSQHPGGQREINELHLPADRPVKITLISEDVIHDFGIAGFRQKIDVLPGRYVSTWYRPDRSPAATTCSATSTAGPATPTWSGRSSSCGRTSTPSGSANRPRARRRWRGGSCS